MVVRDVRHRWNYTHGMIERALLLRQALDSWILEREELRPLYLNAGDWKLLELLSRILKVGVFLILHNLISQIR
ncbi:hypothetical protein B0H10DRAFT_1773707 [Mycena sp. CBHHK59/15]|nr:hypothetical protein B0H10DRAFT_1773707 [Mycena sp. CBHHK59/15]